MFILKALFSFKQFRTFLIRPSEPGRGFGLLKRPIDQRMRLEKSGKKIQSRENVVLFLSLLAFGEETTEKEMKDELFTLISILLMWYCEPIEESNPPPE